MGGYLHLQNRSSDWRIYGLTNNHVINKSEITNDYDLNPRHINEGNTIFLPSQEDLRETRKSPHGDQKYENDALGKLQYASGRRIRSGRHPSLLDWALVSVSETTFKKDRENQKKYKVNTERQLENLLPNFNPPVKHFRALEDGLRVAKYGRTTKATLGTVSAAKTKILIRELEVNMGGRTFYNPENALAVEEWAVTAPMGSQGFCKPGDSGSWVVDEEGVLVGLLFGDIGLLGQVLVTDIKDVFADIKALTGMKEIAIFNP